MAVFRANTWYPKTSFSTSLLMGVNYVWPYDRGPREEQVHLLLTQSNKGSLRSL